MANSKSWEKIFADYNILNHNFNVEPYILTAEQIKIACQNFKKTTEKEVRILCKQDSREDRPDIFIRNNLFILPVKNGEYALIKGEGYVNIPEITAKIKKYASKLDFKLESSLVGNSEMQHLDFAYASSLIRTFIGDDSLVLTIRGRKYTPPFSFKVGTQTIHVESVQTEVDAGYEGRNKIILVEAKNSLTKNTIIRQLFYPFKQWKNQTTKEVLLVFFEKQDTAYNIWQYAFIDENDYNSIHLVKSSRYVIA
jgi:deoxycytidine triphosphate deaminase